VKAQADRGDRAVRADVEHLQAFGIGLQNVASSLIVIVRGMGKARKSLAMERERRGLDDPCLRPRRSGLDGSTPDYASRSNWSLVQHEMSLDRGLDSKVN